jgi:hypothetical protein
MNKTFALLLSCLGGCASTSVHPPAGTAPTFTGSLPTSPDDQDKNAAAAPEKTTLPVGVGLTTGPKSFLIGATLDFPIDKQITIGPSLEHGFADHMSLTSLTGQLKYFLPASGDGSDGMTLLPYLTVGVGMANIDKEGQSGDSGLLINGGAGVRFLTGEHYRIGSEARVNFLPSKLDGERGYLSFELLQIVISF